MRYQRKKYKLVNNDNKTELWLTTDPQNWDESERTLKRSDKTFGVYTELSKNLVFTKEAAIFLKLAYAYKDIEANVTLYEYRYHPKTEVPYLHSTGVFDFSEYKEDKYTVKIPFKSGGLNALIKSQLKEKFELERLEAINGNVINAVDKKTVALTSRRILLVSQLKTNENDALSQAFRMNFSDGNYRTGALSIPLEIIVNSDEKLYTQIKDGSFTTTPNTGTAAGVFYYNNDVSKDLQLNISVSFKLTNVYVDDISNGFFKVDLVRYENGATLDLSERIDSLYSTNLVNAFPGGNPLEGQTITGSYNDTITLASGESLGLQWYAGGNFGGFLQDGDIRLDFDETVAQIEITEDSYREDSQTEAVLYHEAGDKLMQIITGEQNRFYSEFYGRTELGYASDGTFSRTGLSLGFWIRQFLDKNMEISFDDYINTSNAIHNTGYTIEIIDGVETLVVEDMKYFFQDAVAITLPNQVSNLEREAYKEFCDSSLEFGYDDNGEYEEAMGLDEYNIKTGFTTPLTRVDTKYSKISKAKAGSYPKEFARRKPKDGFPTTDTSYDKWLFLLDLKIGNGTALEERVWQDDFEIAPTGVYSPETATNLRLTPSQMEKRHEWFYGAGLTKHSDKKIRYSNTGGNNDLVTKKTGETARGEKDDILISTLEKPRFVNQKITFDYPVDFYVNEQVFGKTNVNGRDIPNYFFKVEFINELNKKETGYLMELKPNKEGKWVLLKSL
ncbi:hypothetical protein [Tenacibaculum sp.]|uniref:hypothetical protein n=1 Tax=Tenacibaculum sp. TaxID=1906242 RepID=UPI003D10897B